MISMNELTMTYVTTCLMHEMSKMKENKPKDNNVTMVLQQDKVDNPLSCKDIKTYLYHGKLCTLCFFYKANNKDKKNVKNANDYDDYTFAM